MSMVSPLNPGNFCGKENSGWCGTPPISCSDFEGTWTKADSLLNIDVAFWGGMVDYQWKIISVDNDELTIYRMSEEYHYSEK